MPSLLVNPKMNPALAARVEASISGRRGQGTTTRAIARRTSWLRLGAALSMVGLVAVMAIGYQRNRSGLAAARATTLREWKRQGDSFTADDLGFLDRMQARLQAYSGPYPGDHVSSELQSPESLAAGLARPSIYVRGPLAAFATPQGVKKAAFDSGKDAFLLCLLAPPSTRTEKGYLERARIALAGGPPVQRLTPEVHRLREIEEGLPFLRPAWGESIQNARNTEELSRLERELGKAPLPAARSAMRAKLLIVVLDETDQGSGPTELDGEHTHDVRALLVELPSDKLLLRVRRRVDPSWIPARRRSQYARELDSCVMALEVRDAATAGHGTPASARIE